jgi:hypothetical protein
MKSNKPVTLIGKLRQVRDKINLEIQDLSLQQLKDYWRKKQATHSAKHLQGKGA